MSSDRKTTFRLSSHGDTLEKRSARFLSEQAPSYETFWRAHVVPLTFRVIYEDLPYVRPTLGSNVMALANTSYAVMHHLVWSQHYRTTLEGTARNLRFQRTELLYCFLSHARSCGDALGYFAEAVDGISKKLGGSPVFNATMTSSRSWTFFPQFDDRFGAVCIPIGKYRNTVVHECPVYVVNNMMPVVARLEEYKQLGLAAVGHAVKSGRQTGAAWVHIPQVIDDMHSNLVRLADDWWRRAHEALSKLPKDRYSALQQEGIEEDRGIGRQDFDLFFESST
jgi:hypothetical protein